MGNGQSKKAKRKASSKDSRRSGGSGKSTSASATRTKKLEYERAFSPKDARQEYTTTREGTGAAAAAAASPASSQSSRARGESVSVIFTAGSPVPKIQYRASKESGMIQGGVSTSPQDTSKQPHSSSSAILTKSDASETKTETTHPKDAQDELDEQLPKFDMRRLNTLTSSIPAEVMADKEEEEAQLLGITVSAHAVGGDPEMGPSDGDTAAKGTSDAMATADDSGGGGADTTEKAMIAATEASLAASASLSVSDTMEAPTGIKRRLISHDMTEEEISSVATFAEEKRVTQSELLTAPVAVSEELIEKKKEEDVVLSEVELEMKFIWGYAELTRKPVDEDQASYKCWIDPITTQSEKTSAALSESGESIKTESPLTRLCHAWAIFDGHGGFDCALYSAKHFLEHLKKWHLHCQPKSEAEWRRLLWRVFLKFDRHMSKLSAAIKGGTTVQIVILTLMPTDDGTGNLRRVIVSANAGDARACMSFANGSQVQQLSYDHSPMNDWYRIMYTYENGVQPPPLRQFRKPIMKGDISTETGSVGTTDDHLSSGSEPDAEDTSAGIKKRGPSAASSSSSSSSKTKATTTGAASPKRKKDFVTSFNGKFRIPMKPYETFDELKSIPIYQRRLPSLISREFEHKSRLLSTIGVARGFGDFGLTVFGMRSVGIKEWMSAEPFVTFTYLNNPSSKDSSAESDEKSSEEDDSLYRSGSASSSFDPVPPSAGSPSGSALKSRSLVTPIVEKALKKDQSLGYGPVLTGMEPFLHSGSMQCEIDVCDLMVIACDGVFDVVSNSECLSLVQECVFGHSLVESLQPMPGYTGFSRSIASSSLSSGESSTQGRKWWKDAAEMMRYYQKIETGQLDNAAHSLGQMSYRKGSADDITIFVIPLFHALNFT